MAGGQLPGDHVARLQFLRYCVKMSTAERKLKDLHGIGKKMLLDLALLGVKSVSDLARCDGHALYKALEKKTGARQGPCVLDTFRCAVAQARDRQLPGDQCNWWWWSRRRLAGKI